MLAPLSLELPKPDPPIEQVWPGVRFVVQLVTVGVVVVPPLSPPP